MTKDCWFRFSYRAEFVVPRYPPDFLPQHHREHVPKSEQYHRFQLCGWSFLSSKCQIVRWILKLQENGFIIFDIHIIENREF